jgi:hypothetical protein
VPGERLANTDRGGNAREGGIDEAQNARGGVPPQGGIERWVRRLHEIMKSRAQPTLLGRRQFETVDGRETPRDARPPESEAHEKIRVRDEAPRVHFECTSRADQAAGSYLAP